MADRFQVKALYDFDAQPGTGELTIFANEILTVVRQDVGEGWWEGVNSKGENGLFPAGYVEVLNSPPPPSIPPPPLPPSYVGESLPQVINDGDDWDDDWDDDDSVYSQDPPVNQVQSLNAAMASTKEVKSVDSRSMTGNDTISKSLVKRNFNRFSTFVKSGGEAFILGKTEMNVSSVKCVTIEEENGEVMWTPNRSPYTCSVVSPKKGSKLRGLKCFITYHLIPSYNNIAVTRRYKHFDWLHGRLEEKFSLIPIPPLPEKQISGRYCENFIEHRMNQLQSWVNRICRHPVLSECEVWEHFLRCTDEKKWKFGKRKAEKDELVGGSFFHAICTPPTSLDHQQVEKQADQFGKFIGKMDESVKTLYNVAVDQQKKNVGVLKKEFQRIADSFKDLGTAFQMDTRPHSEQLNHAIKHTGETYEEIGKMYEEQPKYDFEPMSDVLREYKGTLASWPDVLHIHKCALIKTSEHKKLAEEGKLSAEEVASISHRSDIISYATLAEVNHFQQERIAYFNSMMQSFLTAQIDFYQRIALKLQESLALYDNSDI